MNVPAAWRKPLIVLVVLFSCALVVWLIVLAAQATGGDEGPKKKQVQKITVLPPPPPPPKPPEQEPPPEEEPVEIEEETPPEDLPEEIADDAPPPEGPIGLDAEGVAGSDPYGLTARPGGRGLLSGGGPFAWYKNVLKQDIFQALNEDERLRKKAYEVSFKIWLSKTGAVRDVEIVLTSGNERIDDILLQAVKGMRPVSKKPPIEMPQPVTMQIVSSL